MERRYGVQPTRDYWRANSKPLSLEVLQDHQEFEIKEAEFRPQVESSGITCSICGSDQVNFMFSTHRADKAQRETRKCSVCNNKW